MCGDSISGLPQTGRRVPARIVPMHLPAPGVARVGRDRSAWPRFGPRSAASSLAPQDSRDSESWPSGDTRRTRRFLPWRPGTGPPCRRDERGSRLRRCAGRWQPQPVEADRASLDDRAEIGRRDPRLRRRDPARRGRRRVADARRPRPYATASASAIACPNGVGPCFVNPEDHALANANPIANVPSIPADPDAPAGCGLAERAHRC
mgnify:CR=1 FL=1